MSEKILKILSKGNEFDLDGDPDPNPSGFPLNKFSDVGVQDVSCGGRKMPMAKLLYTNVCDRNCTYCAFRKDRDVERASWTPDKLARTVNDMGRAGLINGMFLSSGLAGNPIAMMSRILETAQILRRNGYSQYMHLKILPGAETAQIEEALRLANRVSVNLEAPTVATLGKIAPEKVLVEELANRLEMASIIKKRRRMKASLVTQFVVGPGGESDSILLKAAGRLSHSYGLSRIYFSGFRPVSGTPLEELPRTESIRIARLYQAEWLMRVYGFDFEDMPIESDGSLPRDKDPKIAWAEAHPEKFPLEINTSDYEHLLRIPGIGPTGARRILKVRRENNISHIEQLHKLHILTERAAPYILLNGKRPQYMHRNLIQLALPFWRADSLSALPSP